MAEFSTDDLLRRLARMMGEKREQPQPVVVNVQLGDLLERLITPRDEIRVSPPVTPLPG